MRTYVYKWGNPVKATFVAQAESFEDAEKRIRPALEAMGIDTKNGYAEVSEIRTPIIFV